MTISLQCSHGYMLPQCLLLSMVLFTSTSALPSDSGSGRFTSLRDRSGWALFRLICVLERGIAFARPANLGPLVLWSPVYVNSSASSYQARAAM